MALDDPGKDKIEQGNNDERGSLAIASLDANQQYLRVTRYAENKHLPELSLTSQTDKIGATLHPKPTDKAGVTAPADRFQTAEKSSTVRTEAGLALTGNKGGTNTLVTDKGGKNWSISRDRDGKITEIQGPDEITWKPRQDGKPGYRGIRNGKELASADSIELTEKKNADGKSEQIKVSILNKSETRIYDSESKNVQIKPNGDKVEKAETGGKEPIKDKSNSKEPSKNNEPAKENRKPQENNPRKENSPPKDKVPGQKPDGKEKNNDRDLEKRKEELRKEYTARVQPKYNAAGVCVFNPLRPPLAGSGEPRLENGKLVSNHDGKIVRQRDRHGSPKDYTHVKGESKYAADGTLLERHLHYERFGGKGKDGRPTNFTVSTADGPKRINDVREAHVSRQGDGSYKTTLITGKGKTYEISSSADGKPGKLQTLPEAPAPRGWAPKGGGSEPGPQPYPRNFRDWHEEPGPHKFRHRQPEPLPKNDPGPRIIEDRDRNYWHEFQRPLSKRERDAMIKGIDPEPKINDPILRSFREPMTEIKINPFKNSDYLNIGQAADVFRKAGEYRPIKVRR